MSVPIFLAVVIWIPVITYIAACETKHHLEERRRRKYAEQLWELYRDRM